MRRPDTTATWTPPGRPIRPPTPAERRVLDLLLEGRSNKEIEIRLNCAPSTVKHHVRRLLRKHQVPTRARLIAVLR